MVRGDYTESGGGEVKWLLVALILLTGCLPTGEGCFVVSDGISHWEGSYYRILNWNFGTSTRTCIELYDSPLGGEQIVRICGAYTVRNCE